MHVRRLEVPIPVAVENQRLLTRYMHTRVGGSMRDSFKIQCRAHIEGREPGAWGLPPATESVIPATFIEGYNMQSLEHKGAYIFSPIL